MKLAVIGVVSATNPIAGADRIHQATVDCADAGVWSGVVGNDILIGAKVLVFLQDAILPQWQRWSFMEKHKWRVRMARFKGVPSECVIVPAEGHETQLEPGTDLTESVGVIKHEKPIPAAIAGDVRGSFPSFIPKTDEENFQRIRDLETLMAGWDWVATLKYDGTSCTVWNDEEGMHVCNRNVELKELSESGKGNVYWQAARKYGLERIPPGFALQFEVIGPGIQGNPCGLEELGMAAFTLHSTVDQERCHFGSLAHLCQSLHLPMAEVVASGHGYVTPDTLRHMAGALAYQNGKPAEGVVVRSINNAFSFKVINLDYKG